MEKLISNYGRLIDQLRKDRNLSRQDLCEGIMSLRNFQRFANGEVSISNDKLSKLVDKLKIDYFYFQQMMLYYDYSEYVETRNAFNETMDLEYKEALFKLAKIDRDKIDSDYLKQLYDIAFLKTKINAKKNVNESFRKLEKVVDYPEVLKKKIVNKNEISALITLCTIYSKKGDRDIIDYLIGLVSTDSFANQPFIQDIVIPIYSTIAKGLYLIESLEECLEFCNKGIQEIQKGFYFGSPTNLFAYKTLVLNKLGKYEEAIESAILLYMDLAIQNSPRKSEVYLNTIEENLGIKFDELIIINKKSES